MLIYKRIRLFKIVSMQLLLAAFFVFAYTVTELPMTKSNMNESQMTK
jgi:hypothetical protein